MQPATPQTPCLRGPRPQTVALLPPSAPGHPPLCAASGSPPGDRLCSVTDFLHGFSPAARSPGLGL